MPHSAPSGQTSLESKFAGEAIALECGGRAQRRPLRMSDKRQFVVIFIRQNNLRR
jgi:hypothetical protein